VSNPAAYSRRENPASNFVDMKRRNEELRRKRHLLLPHDEQRPLVPSKRSRKDDEEAGALDECHAAESDATEEGDAEPDPQG
jgi:hypothetical protein